MSLKAAIFDLDGVIVNTVPLHFKAWKRMFGEYGKKFTMKDYEAKVDGIPRMDGARAVLTDLPEKELEDAALKKEDYFEEFLKAEGVKAYESTTALIKELKRSGVKIGVISSSKSCPLILDKLGLYPLIDVEISGGAILKGKPDPWVFIETAGRLGLEAAECVVFEDAVFGVEAGKRAGMFTIGVDRRDDRRRLEKADLVISDLSEVDFQRLNVLIK